MGISGKVVELETQLAGAQGLRQKIDYLNALAWELRYVDATRAAGLSEKAYRLSLSGEFTGRPYLQGMATSLAHLGQIRTDLGFYVESTTDLMEALEIFTSINDETGCQQVYNSLGRIFYFIGDYSAANENFFYSLALAQKQKDQLAQARIHINIGMCHMKTGSFQLALKHLLEGTQILEGQGDTFDLAFGLNGIANVYLGMGQHHTALEHSQHSIHLAHEANSWANETDGWCTLGDIYRDLDNLDQAIACYQHALELAESHTYPMGKAEAERRLGQTLCVQGDKVKARQTLKAALTLAQEIDIQRLQYECHHALADCYKHTHDYKQAMEHFEQYFTTKEAVFNEAEDTKLKTLEVIHQVEAARQQAEIYQLRVNALQNKVEEQQQVQAELERIASTDSLTRLFTRGRLLALAEQLIQEAWLNGEPFSLILFDLDNFKLVNDGFGHLAGDQVLIGLGERIKFSTRSVDLAGRYGGDEFAILLPNTDLVEALAVAGRLCQAMSGQPFRTGVGNIPVTISAGAAGLAPAPLVRQEDLNPKLTLDKLLATADEALYRVKQSGGNNATG